VIAEAALQEFAAHGYEGAKIANIAKRASVVTPAVHYHYKTKLDLWKAAVDHSFRDYDALTRAFQADLQDLDPLSRLKVIVRRYTSVVFENPARVRIILLEGLRNTERSRWLIEKHLRPSHEDSKALFDALRDSGIIKPYSGLTILSMLGGAVVTELANTYMVGDLYGIDEVNAEVIAEKADAIIDIMFTGILAS
jgi:AcrR family transcriptional regulator